MSLRHRGALAPCYYLVTALAVRFVPIVMNTAIIITFATLAKLYPAAERHELCLKAALAIGAILGGLRARWIPSAHSAYFNWLRQTPWTARQKLPLGLPLPGLLDGAILAACVCILTYGDARFVLKSLLAVGAYAAGYIVIFGWKLCGSGRWTRLYAIAVGVVAVIATIRWPFLAAGIGLCVFMLILFSARSHLQWLAHESSAPEKPRPTLDPSLLGWPFSALGTTTRRLLGIKWALLWALLIGFLTFAIMVDAVAGNVQAAAGAVSHAALIAAFILAPLRTFVYAYQCKAPLSVGGRLATGQFVIWGYDKIFLAPVTAILVALAMRVLPAGFLTTTTVPIYGGLSLFLVVLAGLGIGPTLQNWWLTGHYQAVRGVVGASDAAGPPAITKRANPQ